MTTPTTATNPLQLYLASSSPRRKELLQLLGIRFQVLPKAVHPVGMVDEPIFAHETPQTYVKRTVLDKLAWGVRIHQKHSLPPGPILAADTIVILNEKVLGKPLSRQDAEQILHQLSGQAHTVATAVALSWQQKTALIVQESIVHFAPLSTQDIKRYCASDEPYDKAGAYGIQGPAQAFISHIEGSYSGVMGLPLYETKKLLQTHHIFDSLLQSLEFMLD